MIKLNLSELKLEEVPNIDFIGTVESSATGIEYKKYPIEVPRQFFILLMAMARDDAKSVLHMQSAFDERYGSVGTDSIDANFLAPKSLDDRFVDIVVVPAHLSKDEYLSGAKQVEMQLRQTYEGNTEPRLPFEVCLAIHLQRYRRRLKYSFLSRFLRFQAAYGYAQALRKYKILERLNQEVRMVSTDTIGWTTYNYEINNDICIQLDSNFGYGRSSYFLLSLRYKGIEIYPFSAYVKYPYANMRTLIGHTRTYRVDRRSWQDALEFVAETANYAMRFPQSFVDKFIFGEIQKMMEGLRNILYKENLDDPVTLTRPQYLGVSVEGICNSEYVASSDEMLLVQKSERIIGALAVLEKLKTLDTIVKDIEESIHEIIVMVKKLLPELVDGIRRVEAELLMHEFESGCLDSFYQCACVELEKHKRVLQNMEDEALNKQGSDILPSDKIFILREVLLDYRRTTPAYDHVLDGCKVFGDLKRKMDSHIVARKRFLDSLRKCFGVGSRGARFWVVLEKLHPYEVEIERIVMQQAKQLSGKNTVRGLDGIRDSVYAAYRRSHPVVDELLKERDFVLDEIDTFRCSRVKN